MSATYEAIGFNVGGLPRTLRLTRQTQRNPAYRRLAVAILELDVATLTSELRGARLGTSIRD
jgi:hypothetical protein